MFGISPEKRCRLKQSHWATSRHLAMAIDLSEESPYQTNAPSCGGPTQVVIKDVIIHCRAVGSRASLGFGLPGSLAPQSSAFFARSSICRWFALCKGQETRVNSGGAFSTANKTVYFDESV
jgi:hypothetical protein